MPRGSYCPRWALMLEADWRAWSGSNVYTRGGVPVSLPAWPAGGAGLSSGIYPDALAALCGRASGAIRSLFATLGLPDPDAGIDENDRVWFESSDAGWQVLSGGASLGFTGAAVSVNMGGGRWRCTAQADWTRGPVALAAIVLSIQFGGGGAIVTTTTNACRCQDVPSGIRPANYTGDGLAWGTASLRYLDELSTADAAHRHGWHLDQYGRVVESGANALPAAVWGPSAFRDALGFTGTETKVITGTGWTVTATRPCAGVLCPSRPAERVDHGVEVVGDGARLIGGDTTSVLVGHARTVRLSPVWIDGPLDAAPQGLWRDLSDHYHRAVAPLMVPGAKGELYQDYGDCRRVGRTQDGHTYGLARTVELEPYRGRLEVAISPGSPSSRDVTWAQVMRRRGTTQDLLLDLREDR